METVRNGHEDRRTMPRWSMDETAVFLSDDALHPCKVVDISASGVKLHHKTTLAPDTELSLHLCGVQPLPLRIVRVQPDHAAAIFVDGPHYLFR